MLLALTVVFFRKFMSCLLLLVAFCTVASLKVLTMIVSDTETEVLDVLDTKYLMT